MTPTGRLVLDRVAPGRGAWMCNPANACFEMARKRRGFDKAFRQPVDAAAIEALREGLGGAPDMTALREG
jgi:predicted RNA-binding protein YlxR (DUF448 family)